MGTAFSRVGSRIIQRGRRTATGPGDEIVDVGEAHAQTVQAVHNIRRAFEQSGARVEEVVRTRLYVAAMAQWEAVGRAHGGFFGQVRPATAMVEVSHLIDPAMLVEVEAEANVSRPETRRPGQWRQA